MVQIKIKKIAIPLDGSKNSFRVLDDAILLANTCEVTLTGIYLMDRPPEKGFSRIEGFEKKILQNDEKS